MADDLKSAFARSSPPHTLEVFVVVCVWEDEDEDEEAIINNSCAWIARHSNSGGGMQAAENLLRINL